MFADAALVLKNGRVVVRDGVVVERVHGVAQTVQTEYDRRIERSLNTNFDHFHGLCLDNFIVNDVAFSQTDDERFAARALTA